MENLAYTNKIQITIDSLTHSTHPWHRWKKWALPHIEMSPNHRQHHSCLEYIKMKIWPREMLNRLRNHDCSSPQFELRRVVVTTTMVLATNRDCAGSSEKPQFATPPIVIALICLRNNNCCQNQSGANNKLNELNTIKWKSCHMKWVRRDAGRNCAKLLSEQHESSPTIKIAPSRFRSSY